MARPRRRPDTVQPVVKPPEAKTKSSRRWTSIGHESLPDFLRDNEYLLKGHRPQLESVIECFRSLFRTHTETWNIWTHLLGCAAFVLIALYTLTRPPDEINFIQKIVFSPFFAGAIICMGFSSLFHTLACHSPKMCKIFAKLDYVGIIILIVSSYPPWLHYGFKCRHWIQILYLAGVVVCGIGCVAVVMMDKFGTPQYRPLRAVLFMGLGLMGIFPGGHFLIDEGILSKGLYEALTHAGWLVFMGFLYLGGAVIYAARVPERLCPGMFDIVGQSHQIMHLCVIAGAYSCYYGASKLAHHRSDLNITCS